MEFRGAGLLARVFRPAGATITMICITRPVLPVIRAEFRVTAAQASITVSAD